MKRIKGKKFDLVFRKKRLPNGRVVDLQMVDHPGAVVIVPYWTRDKIILLKQFRPVVGKTIFECPAGTLEKNERPLRCAHRELREETGFAARKMKRCGKIYPAPGYSNEIIIVYEASDLTRRPAAGDEDEVITPVVKTRRQVREMVAKGQIKDAKTVCALSLTGVLSASGRG